MVPGQHAKEFRDFLSKFPDEFVIKEDEDVIFLKEYENQIRHQLLEVQHDQSSPSGRTVGGGNGATNIDPRVTAKILSLAREELEKCHNVSSDIENIFAKTEASFRLCHELDNLIFPFKRSQDLDTFLKMHSHLFRVQSGSVTLVPLKNHYGNVQPIVINKSSSSRTGITNSVSNEELSTSGGNVDGKMSPMAQSCGSGSSSNCLLNKTLKQRVNSVVLKALADNGDRERRGAQRGEETNTINNKTASKVKYVYKIA